MIKKIIIFSFWLILTLTSFTSAYAVTTLPAPSGANPWLGKNSSERLQEFASWSGFSSVPQTPQEVVGNIVKIVLSLMGVLLIVLILYGGILWMTSAGTEDKIDKAKKIITNAAIGLTITLTAYAIASFITGSLAKAL